MNPRPLELLAPARNRHTAFAAIDSGADAVYMGFEGLGARAAASNSAEDVRAVADYAHLFGTKLYITLNTIVYEEELERARGYVRDVFLAGADAIIVQDMAYLQMNECNMTIHLSTQADLSDVGKIRFFESLGVQRAVLARELSVEQIAEIHSECPTIELESFVHGALCCSFSGQCYLSEYQVGRSANRGECCQSCRSRYDLVDESGNVLIRDRYLLSTKDLNASSELEKLIRAGVVSFKIEGRLKDEGYVRNVCAYYSDLLDAFCSRNPAYARASYGKSRRAFTPDVSRSFNRGFTIFNLQGKSEKTGNIHFAKSIGEPIGRVQRVQGAKLTIDTAKPLHSGDGLVYLNGENNLEGLLVNSAFGKEVTANRRADIALGTMLYRNRDVEFDKRLSAKENCRKIGVRATLTDAALVFETENGCTVGLELPSGLTEARNRDNYAENLRRQIGKFGGEVFALTDFSIETERRPFFPIALLNDLRRRAVGLLKAELQRRNAPRHTQKLNADVPYYKPKADYRENISNSQSEQFYRSRGVRVEEKAFELQPKRAGVELMRSKNCLLYNLGQCKRRDKLRQGYKGELFLRDNRHTYRLSFDCSKCEMSVWSM